MRISDWSSDVCSSDLFVTISITPGFSAAQKKQLMQRSSDAVEQSIGAPLASIRVLLHELQDGCYLNAGEFNTPGLMFVVDFIAGRTVEQQAALIAALSRDGTELTGIPETEVREIGRAPVCTPVSDA